VPQPTKYQFIINLKTTNALGLTIPVNLTRLRRPTDRVTNQAIVLDRCSAHSTSAWGQLRRFRHVRVVGRFTSVNRHNDRGGHSRTSPRYLATPSPTTTNGAQNAGQAF
jgi:hypothetical protein